MIKHSSKHCYTLLANVPLHRSFMYSQTWISSKFRFQSCETHMEALVWWNLHGLPSKIHMKMPHMHSYETNIWLSIQNWFYKNKLKLWYSWPFCHHFQRWPFHFCVQWQACWHQPVRPLTPGVPFCSTVWIHTRSLSVEISKKLALNLWCENNERENLFKQITYTWTCLHDHYKQCCIVHVPLRWFQSKLQELYHSLG